ncbi:MAG: hypothetical protein AB7K09_03675 [Planctomycetota bacterium]
MSKDPASNATATRPESPSGGPTGPAMSASEAAVSLVQRSAASGNAADHARTIRRRALMAVSVGVLAFLARTMVACMIIFWQFDPVPTHDSDMVVRIADRSIGVLTIMHEVLGWLAVGGILLYAMLHAQFHALHAQLNLTPEAAARRVRGSGWAVIPALLITALGIAGTITSLGLPPKPSPAEYYKLGDRMFQREPGQSITLDDIRERDPSRGVPVPWFIKQAGDTTVALWLVNQLLLPVLVVLVVLLMLVPVYSVQKARIAPEDIVPAAASPH